VLQKATEHRGGVLLAAVLGGAYSSTVMTVVLARRARTEERPHLFAGAMLVASGVMFLRMVALLALFNGALAAALGPSLAVLALVAAITGFVLSRVPDRRTGEVERKYVPKNPLELGAALLFGVVFVGILVVTQLAVRYLGSTGVYVLAAIMGVADVDPFIMGMTQAAGAQTALHVAATAIVLTVASNNVMKGVYAYAFADRETGRLGLAALVALALAGLVPMLYV
jgi:uncharacterized membrane protein (DUF4010 family)